MEYKRILVRGVNWVGDSVFVTPSLTTLRTGFPKARISLLIPEKVGDIYRGNPNIDELIIDKSREGGLRERIKLIRSLKEKEFQLGIIMQSTSYDPAILFFLARIPERIGYSHSLRNLLLTKVVARPRKVLHEVDFFLGLIETLGIGIKTKEVFMPEDKEASRWAREFLANHGYREGEVLVGIFPGAYFGPAKRWFPARYAALSNRLQEEYGAKVIIFGGKNDLTLTQKIINDLKGKVIDATGKTSLRQLRALIGKCRLFITNDSGPLQVASTTATPIVALFGSSSYKKTGPWRKKDCTVICKEVSCSPCFRRDCRHLSCFGAITVEEVLAAVKTYLS
jgi:heptosyltransferase-2